MAHESLQVKRTKKAIRDALLSLLECHNFGEITVEMVASQANVNRSTIYRHYCSLLDVLGDCIYQIAGKADESVPTGAYPELMSQVRETTHEALLGIKENIKLYSLLGWYASGFPGAADHVRFVQTHSEMYYKGLVENLIKSRPNILEKPEILAKLLESISGAIISQWVASGFAELTETVADKVVAYQRAIIERALIPSETKPAH